MMKSSATIAGAQRALTGALKLLGRPAAHKRLWYCMIRASFSILATAYFACVPGGAYAFIDARHLIGTWTCQPREGGPAFTWVVEERILGGWLTGEGYEDGVLTSLEVWAMDEEGRLRTRRQFSPRGGYIELDVVQRERDAVRSEGMVLSRDGTAVDLRHSLWGFDGSHFNARWEVFDNEEWVVVADETCRRS